MVKISVKVSASACFHCNTKPITQVYIGKNDASRTKLVDILTSGGSENVWYTGRVAIPANTDLALHFYDPTGGGWQRYSFVATPGELTPREYHHSSDGAFWKSVLLNMEGDVCDGALLTSVSGEGTPNCNCKNICVEGASGNLVLTLSATHPGTENGIWVYAYDKNFNQIGNDYVLGYANQKTVQFNFLGLQNYWQQDVYLQIRTTFSSSTKYVTSPYYLYKFFEKIPAPVSYSLVRTACFDKLLITMPTGWASKYSGFKFTISNGTVEGASNAYGLSVSRSGDVLTLICSNQDYSFPDLNTTHTLQIADKDNLSCAREVFIAGAPKPEYPDLSLTPVVKHTIGGIDYHLSRYSATDGSIKLTISNYNSCKQPLRVQYKARSASYYYYVALSSLERETGTNNWILKNLSGNTYYDVYIVDVDGCSTISNLKSAYLKKPDPVVINYTENTKLVTCHAQNGVTSPDKRSDGDLYVSWTGGIPPYKIYQDGALKLTDINDHSTTLSGLSSGFHEVTVYDQYSVKNTKYSILVSTNSKLTVTPSNAPILCYGYNTDITATVSNNQTNNVNYVLLNSDGSVNESKTGNPSVTFNSKYSTNYTVQAESNGCIATSPANIGQPNDINIAPTPTHVAEYEGSNGKINFDITGGVADYDYIVTKDDVEKASGSTSRYIEVSGLSAGFYKIDITDANGCTKSKSNIEVKQPDAPLELAYSKTDADCYGNATGTITLTAKGGWGGYTYKINGNAAGSTINGLTASTTPYTVSVYDAMEATRSKEVLITQPDRLWATPEVVTNLICYDDHSGTATINISGGVTPYKVSTDNSSWVDGNYLSGLSANNALTVYVKDDNGCPATTTVSITQPNLLIASVKKVHNLQCYQDGTGSVKLNVGGGTPSYQISPDSVHWMPGDSVYGLSANPSQSIWVKDTHGCTTSITTPITQPDLLQATAKVYNLKCFEDHSGAVKMNITGGTSPFWVSTDNLSWIPGDSIHSLSANPALKIYVKDNHLCTTNHTVAINQPPLFVNTVDSVYDLKCFNDASGAIKMKFSGGTSPYYVSTDSSTWDQTDSIFHLSAASALKVYVRDHHGCSNTHIIAIHQPEVLTSSVLNVKHLRCFNDKSGAVKLSIQGGTHPYSISPDDLNWTPGDSLGSLDASIAQQIFVKDKNNCRTNNTVTINEPPKLVIAVDTVINTYCGQRNGGIHITAKGGTVNEDYIYSWYSVDSDRHYDIPDLDSIYSGQYKLWVSDDHDCKDSLTLSVSDLDGPKLMAYSTDTVSCYGYYDGAIHVKTVTSGGGTYYFFLDGASVGRDIDKLRGGRYLLRIVDNKNCKQDNYISIHQPDSIHIAPFLTWPSCYGYKNGNLSVNVSGGNGNFQYQWNTKGRTAAIENLVTGTYTLTVTDVKNCTAIKAIDLPQPDLLEIKTTVVKPLCYYSSDGSINAMAKGGNGGYRYTWSTSDTTRYISNLRPGRYSVKVTDVKNCQADTFALIVAPDSIKIKSLTENPSCYGFSDGSIASEVTGGTGSYLYWWNNGSNHSGIGGLKDNSYNLTVRDDNNCEFQQAFKLTEPQPLDALARVVAASCNGYSDGSVAVTVNGGNGDYKYLWNTNETANEINTLEAGIYHLKITDQKNCELVKDYEVREPDPVRINVVMTRPVCHDSRDGSIAVSTEGGNGNFRYRWTTGDTTNTAEGIFAGSYTVTVTDVKNCELSASYDLTAPMPPSPGWKTKNAVLCTGNILKLDGGNFTSFTWSDQNKILSTDRNISLNKTGEYFLKITNERGCVGLDTFYLEVSDHPLRAKIVLPDSVQVNESAGAIDVTWPVPDSINWLFDQPVTLLESNQWSQHFSAGQEGLIYVTLRTWFGGCSSDSTKTIYIYGSETIQRKDAVDNEPLITRYIVRPNPNDGNFTVEVRLSRKANIRLTLFNIKGNGIINLKESQGLDLYEVEYSLPELSRGSYLLVLSAEKEQQSLIIIIN